MVMDSGWWLLSRLLHNPFLLDVLQIQIVGVVLEDLPLLQEISKKTFFDSFAVMNTAENMKFHLDHHFTAEKLRTEILNPGSKFYFALFRGTIAGYLKMNTGHAQTVLPNDEGVEIERIYVDGAFKGKGIGKVFVSKVIDVATKLHAKYIWLGVWEHNAPAIRFYEKNGFRKFSRHLFRLGDDDQTDLLLKKYM